MVRSQIHRTLPEPAPVKEESTPVAFWNYLLTSLGKKDEPVPPPVTEPPPQAVPEPPAKVIERIEVRLVPIQPNWIHWTLIGMSAVILCLQVAHMVGH